MYAQILPYVNAMSIQLENVETIITILNKAFNNPDWKVTAQWEVQKLKQGNCDFTVYWADFQHWIMNTEFNEEAQKNALMNGLSDEVLTLLQYHNTPDALIDYVELL